MTAKLSDEEKRHFERRADYCPVHEERGNDINDIKTALFTDIRPKVHTQVGQWKVLLWGLGGFLAIFSTLVLNFTSDLKERSEKMMSVQGRYMESVINIDKALSTYIGSHEQQSKDGFRRLDTMEKILNNHEDRLRILEKDKY
jgi:hypothetical protein